MTESFQPQWTEWIATNKARGCGVKDMFHAPLKNGFSPQLIRQELKGTLLTDEEIVLAD